MAIITIGFGCAWSVNGLARRWHVVDFVLLGVPSKIVCYNNNDNRGDYGGGGAFKFGVWNY